MNPNNPLEALRPLQLPHADFAWPLAPGWWVLLALLILGLCSLLWWSRRRYRANRVRRSALQRLRQIEAEWQTEANSIQACEAVNAALKATALHYFGQTPTALSGSAWQTWLRSQLGPRLESKIALDFTLTMYAGDSAVLWKSREATLSDARLWLQKFQRAAQ